MALVPCNAHEWYDQYCCGGHDCGPIIAMSTRPDGSRFIMIETMDGDIASAVFPPDFPIRPSQDGKPHACILNTDDPLRKPRCLYLTGDV